MAVQSSKPSAYLSSYIQTYLKEEIQYEGLTRNIAAFTRFLEAASFSQAQSLSVSAVARECSVDRKVVEDYFSILNDLLLSYELPVFTKKAKRKLQRHRKFYFFDVGVYRTLRPKGPLDLPDEMDGPALETLVLQEIKAQNFYSQWDYEIFYWRTFDHLEVDFILYGHKKIHAIEVKRSNRVRPEDLKGLKAFLTDYPGAKQLVLYGGEKSQTVEGIEVVPVQSFLKNMAKYLGE